MFKTTSHKAKTKVKIKTSEVKTDFQDRVQELNFFMNYKKEERWRQQFEMTVIRLEIPDLEHVKFIFFENFISHVSSLELTYCM